MKLGAEDNRVLAECSKHESPGRIPCEFRRLRERRHCESAVRLSGRWKLDSKNALELKLPDSGPLEVPLLVELHALAVAQVEVVAVSYESPAVVYRGAESTRPDDEEQEASCHTHL